MPGGYVWTYPQTTDGPQARAYISGKLQLQMLHISCHYNNSSGNFGTTIDCQNDTLGYKHVFVKALQVRTVDNFTYYTKLTLHIAK